MTVDLEPFQKSKPSQDAELPGLILVVSLVMILMTLALLMS
ncbi:hypothetical protein [Nocardioides sp. Kera G14]|nr:hypothetical protein [Nocardioides sp. Kera G14]